MFFTRSLASAAGSGKKTTVQLFYDIISPYTYIQFELLTRQKAQWPSMSLKFTPVSIGTLMKEAGNAPPMMVPAKGVYMLGDLGRLSDFHKIPFQMRSDFPKYAFKKGTTNTQRFLLALQQQLNSEDEKSEALIRRFFADFFSPDKPSPDLSDLEVIRSIALSTGVVDAGAVDKAVKDSSSEEIKEMLKKNTEDAGALGGFGLPITAIHLPDGQMEAIWGSDRMHIIGHLLGESKAPILK